jgi:acetyltransferase-like isoleucine patch superfamily enzyme
MPSYALDLPAWVTLGDGHEADPNVFLGYLTGRSIEQSLPTIGAGLQTGHNVVIREENTIGDNLNIWNNSTIDYGCTIGSGVKIHCNVYVAQYTILEDEVFLAPGVTIANDPHPLCGQCLRGPTLKRRARIGVNVTLLPHITIGESALIGAGSVVTQDIPSYAVAYGNPARVHKTIHELECFEGIVEHPYVDGMDVRTQQQNR